jgi:hypothetical protein
VFSSFISKKLLHSLDVFQRLKKGCCFLAATRFSFSISALAKVCTALLTLAEFNPAEILCFCQLLLNGRFDYKVEKGSLKQDAGRYIFKGQSHWMLKC